MAQLAQLRAIGPNGAWVLVKEVFGWRRFANRRELAGCLGLAPTHYSSGDLTVEPAVRVLAERQPLLRARDLVGQSLPTAALTPLVAAGKLERVARVVCLLSAPRVHGIGTQAPFEVWVGIPRHFPTPPPGPTNAARSAHVRARSVVRILYCTEQKMQYNF